MVTATGAGLGLSIVRSIASAHDGEVTARARADGGLVVTVVLPLSHGFPNARAVGERLAGAAGENQNVGA